MLHMFPNPPEEIAKKNGAYALESIKKGVIDC